MTVVGDISKDCPVHFIGIGGIGMSGIALTFIHRGYRVTGSDLNGSSVTARLAGEGAEVYQGPSASNVPRGATVVYSSAVGEENPEMVEARAMGLPVIRRAEALAWLMKGKVPIAIAGTHGKTTTTSLVALMLHRAGYAPSAIVGGIVDAFGGNVLCGEGPHLVAEADESDGTLVNFYPAYSIITNIEEEHLGFYNDLGEILDTFDRFILNTLCNGKVIYNLDEPNVRNLVQKYKGDVISYSISRPADVFAGNISLHGFGSTFEVLHEGEALGTMELSIPGVHNVAKSLGALAVALKVGIPFETVREAISGYRGVRRRFEVKGLVDDVLVIDDYAHHPTEVAATLHGARNVADGGRLVAVFQPHRYTRTRHLHKRFSGAFASADRLILTDVYGANEPAMEGVDGRMILRSVLESGQENVEYFPDIRDIPEFLLETVNPGDVVITMGAGNISIVAEELVRRLKERRTQLAVVTSNGR